MKQLSKQSSCLLLKKYSRIKLSTFIAITCLGTSGCLTSPYYGQTFESTSAQIPLTVWTRSNSKPITIECAGSSSNGKPVSSYKHIATILPNKQSTYDSLSLPIYSASIKKALPADLLQDGSDEEIYTFNKAGLKCLGEKIGETGSWYGWSTGSECRNNFRGNGKEYEKLAFIRVKL